MFRNKKKNQPQGRNPRITPGSQVFSYYATRTRDRESAGQAAREVATHQSRKSWRHRVPIILLSIVAVVCLFRLTTLSASPRIVPLADKTPNLLQPSDVYAQYVSGLLNESIFNKNKLFLNSNEVALKLKTEFPELEDVSVTIPFIQRRPIVEIKPAEPAVLLNAPGSSFVIGRNGKAVVDTKDAPASMVEGLPLVQDQTGLEIDEGANVLTTDSIAFIQGLAAQLKAAAIPVESIILPPTPYEIHVRINGEGHYVKFHSLGDVRLQSGALIATREKLARDGIKPAEYIDVRLEDKVYYR